MLRKFLNYVLLIKADDILSDELKKTNINILRHRQLISDYTNNICYFFCQRGILY